MLNKFIGRGVLGYNGITWPEYADGVPLSAYDLNAAQEAVNDHQKLLAQATGYGVANGLWVTDQVTSGQNAEPTVLRIAAGLGITRAGGIVSLPNDKLINLRDFVARTVTPTMVELTPVIVADFRLCSDSAPAVSTNVGDGLMKNGRTFGVDLQPGVYVLVARPDTCLDTPAGNGRGTATVKEGVSFYLYGLQENFQNNLGSNQVNQPSIDRNRRAYWHFGTSQLTTNLYWPFDFDSATKYTDAQQTPPLSDLLTAEVLPLAVIVLSRATNGQLKIELVDNWPVRRRMVQAGPAQSWEPISGDRRAAEGQARFYQFQEHLSALMPTLVSQLQELKSADGYFRWLPPVGFLPLAMTTDDVISSSLFFSIKDWLEPLLSRSTLQTIFDQDPDSKQRVLDRIVSGMYELIVDSDHPYDNVDAERFFGPSNVDYVYTDVQAGHQLLNLSWYDPPIDLQNHPRLRIYVIFPDFQTVYKTALVLWDAADSAGTDLIMREALNELLNLDVQNQDEIDPDQTFFTTYGVFTLALFYDQRKANGYEFRAIGG